MAEIQKRAGKYRVRIRRKGITQSRTFDSKREAEDWASRIEGKIRGDEYRPAQTANISLGAAIEWFLERIAPVGEDGKRRVRSQHVKNQITAARYWLDTEFAKWPLHGIHKSDLTDWVRSVLDYDNRGPRDPVGPNAEFGAQTCIHRLNFLSKLYNEWNDVHSDQLVNPVQPRVRPAMPKHRTRRLHESEERRLLAACAKSESKWLRPIVELAMHTAMRQGELLGLTWRDIDWKGQTAFLKRTKNGESRTVPMPPPAVAVLKALFAEARKDKTSSGDPLNRPIFLVATGRAVTHAFSRACADAKPPLEDLHFHDLRHEATSRLFEHTDLQDQVIRQITGHKSAEILDRYANLRLKNPALMRRMRQDWARLPALRSPR